MNSESAERRKNIYSDQMFNYDISWKIKQWNFVAITTKKTRRSITIIAIEMQQDDETNDRDRYVL